MSYVRARPLTVSLQPKSQCWQPCKLQSCFTTIKKLLSRVTPPLPKCLYQKEEKWTKECRVFQTHQINRLNIIIYSEVNTKIMYLVCNQQVSVLKECNIRRYYETHHKEKYHHLKGQLRGDKQIVSWSEETVYFYFQLRGQ